MSGSWRFHSETVQGKTETVQRKEWKGFHSETVQEKKE